MTAFRPWFLAAQETVDTGGARPSPEKNLLFAIVERAISDLGDVDRIIRRSAINWICSTIYTEADPFSFLWIMSELSAPEDAIEKFRAKALVYIRESEQVMALDVEAYLHYRKHVLGGHKWDNLFALACCASPE